MRPCSSTKRTRLLNGNHLGHPEFDDVQAIRGWCNVAPFGADSEKSGNLFQCQLRIKKTSDQLFS